MCMLYQLKILSYVIYENLTFSPPRTTSFASSKVVVDPSPVKEFVIQMKILEMVVDQYMPFVIPYTSSKTDTVISTSPALASASKLSPLEPSFCNTNLFPDITSSVIHRCIFNNKYVI